LQATYAEMCGWLFFASSPKSSDNIATTIARKRPGDGIVRPYPIVVPDPSGSAKIAIISGS